MNTQNKGGGLLCLIRGIIHSLAVSGRGYELNYSAINNRHFRQRQFFSKIFLLPLQYFPRKRQQILIQRNFSQCAEEQVTSSHFFLQLLHSGWCRQVICLTLRRKCFQDLPFIMDCKCKTFSEGKKKLTQNAIDEYGDTFKSS